MNSQSSFSKIYLQINEKGEVIHNGTLIQNTDVLEEFFSSLKFLDNQVLTSLFHGDPCIVEYFDEPLIAQKVHYAKDQFIFELNHALPFRFSANTLTLDEWDRFHGYTHDQIPFVFSPKAQDEFFNLLDEYSDDSITIDGKTISIPNYWPNESAPEDKQFWSDKYKNNESRWDLGTCSPVLKENYSSLKLPISRIAVLGGGSGHDAAFLAEQGHHVTLFDFSPEAIQLAQAKYSHLHNLKCIEADAFQLMPQYHGAFDIVFEHTFYCAINPSRRPEVIQLWKSLTHETGQIMGVFFAMEKRQGPPYGGSEWELKNRLHKNWNIIKWNRSRNSEKSRTDKEFFVFASKK